jgi:hypothetical protein
MDPRPKFTNGIYGRTSVEWPSPAQVGLSGIATLGQFSLLTPRHLSDAVAAAAAVIAMKLAAEHSKVSSA